MNAFRQAPAAPSRAPDSPACVPASSGHLAAVVAAALGRACDPGVERVVGRFEGDQQQRPGAVAGAVVEGLARVEEPAVGGVEPGLGDRPAGGDRVLEALELGGQVGAVGRPVLEPHPGLGDDAEGALGAEEEPVGARSGAVAGEAAGLHQAAGVTTRSDSTKSSMWV